LDYGEYLQARSLRTGERGRECIEWRYVYYYRDRVFTALKISRRCPLVLL
jgi:hypothetical protein